MDGAEPLSAFQPDQAVVVVDKCSCFYLQAGFVDYCDTIFGTVHVKMPGVRDLVEFGPQQIQGVK